MRLLPVIDLMAEDEVGAALVAGRRREYRPIISQICASSKPLEIARAFRTQFGLDAALCPDLDAIAGGDPALAVYSKLRRDGFRLWIDAGVSELKRVRLLADVGVEQIIIGLETAGPAVLAKACRAFGERIVFSLDLLKGAPLGDAAAWQTLAPEKIVDKAIVMGVRKLIVLDLAQVGLSTGAGTEELCERLRAAHPDLDLIAGGGVGGPEDLSRLRGCGVGMALVASALHDGRLTRSDCEEL